MIMESSMKNALIGTALAAAALVALPSQADARTYSSFSITIGDGGYYDPDYDGPGYGYYGYGEPAYGYYGYAQPYRYYSPRYGYYAPRYDWRDRERWEHRRWRGDRDHWRRHHWRDRDDD